VIVGVLTRVLLDVIGVVLVLLYVGLLVFLCVKIMDILAPIYEILVKKICGFFGFYEDNP